MTERAATTTREVFAERLKQAQAEADITNEALARRVGVSVRLLQVWRSGKGAPSASKFASLTVALKRDAAWFYETDKEAA